MREVMVIGINGLFNYILQLYVYYEKYPPE